jgi:hypothetical protein
MRGILRAGTAVLTGVTILAVVAVGGASAAERAGTRSQSVCTTVAAGCTAAAAVARATTPS